MWSDFGSAILSKVRQRVVLQLRYLTVIRHTNKPVRGEYERPNSSSAWPPWLIKNYYLNWTQKAATYVKLAKLDPESVVFPATAPSAASTFLFTEARGSISIVTKNTLRQMPTSEFSYQSAVSAAANLRPKSEEALLRQVGRGLCRFRTILRQNWRVSFFKSETVPNPTAHLLNIFWRYSRHFETLVELWAIHVLHFRLVLSFVREHLDSDLQKTKSRPRILSLPG